MALKLYLYKELVPLLVNETTRETYRFPDMKRYEIHTNSSQLTPISITELVTAITTPSSMWDETLYQLLSPFTRLYGLLGYIHSENRRGESTQVYTPLGVYTLPAQNFELVCKVLNSEAMFFDEGLEFGVSQYPLPLLPSAAELYNLFKVNWKSKNFHKLPSQLVAMSIDLPNTTYPKYDSLLLTFHLENNVKLSYTDRGHRVKVVTADKWPEILPNASKPEIFIARHADTCPWLNTLMSPAAWSKTPWYKPLIWNASRSEIKLIKSTRNFINSIKNEHFLEGSYFNETP